MDLGHAMSPQRTCVACREVDDKREYTRLVRTPDSDDVEVDPTAQGQRARSVPAPDP